MAELRNQKVIALLKAEKNTEGKDPYTESLNAAGYSSVTIPTLSFQFINQDILEKCLKCVEEYSGIIFTSTRAVEAVYEVLKIQEEKLTLSWKMKINFSVGESTANLAKKLLDFDTHGKDAGNSKILCDIILGTGNICKPLIFPCSNIRKDTIPEVLSEHGMVLKEIVCYETLCNPNFKEGWQKIVSEYGLPHVLVFFSPSGVHCCHQYIKDAYQKQQKLQCLAIGCSTEKALNEVSIKVHGVAAKPNALAVCEAVKKLLNS